MDGNSLRFDITITILRCRLHKKFDTTNEYLINRSIKANCIYLEDLLENVTLCERILERLNKPELAYILNYFFIFY